MTAPRPFAEVLAELTRLDAAATPGPITIKDETNLIASDGYGLTSLSGNVGDPRSRNMANAAKAAAAWNALPALLARAAVFEAAVAWQKMGADVAATMRGNFVERRLVCDRLRAAIARAQAAENQTGAEEER